ncbi:unnamed protein product, partial [Onchocerca flexuosa]|uniref:Uncharacterized protein n=1 Tax=Onchocerca flexuosa TaxID=387005 RepID=A0A183I767_9BILA
MEQTHRNSSQCLRKKVKNIEFNAHSYSPAIIIKYELESAKQNLEDASAASPSKRCKKIIQLKDLNERVDTLALARHITQVCPIIPECRIPELERILHQLQKRHNSDTFKRNTNLSTEYLDITLTSQASMNNIE